VEELYIYAHKFLLVTVKEWLKSDHPVHSSKLCVYYRPTLYYVVGSPSSES